MAAYRPPLRSGRCLCLQEFSIGSEQIDALYHYAKFQFECGNYSTASEFLYHYRTLSTDPERNMSALWGKLAATILQQVEPHCSASPVTLQLGTSMGDQAIDDHPRLVPCTSIVHFYAFFPAEHAVVALA